MEGLPKLRAVGAWICGKVNLVRLMVTIARHLPLLFSILSFPTLQAAHLSDVAAALS